MRVRLAIAFTAVLLGPALLLGALAYRAIGSGQRASADAAGTTLAISAVRGQILAECDRLTATARTIAVQAAVRHQPSTITPTAAVGVWALCGDAPQPGVRYTGLAARVPIGDGPGWAYAVRPVDAAFLARLSTAAGRPVTVGDTGSSLAAAGPLPLVLGPAPTPGNQFWPVAFAAVTTALVLAVVFGIWLAALATRPLLRLVTTVDQAAAGDLTARSRLTGRDEVGQLGVRLDRLVDTMSQTQRLAVTDALTGLGNLRDLLENVRLETERAARFRRTVGVLLLDLDHFKSVNDSYGHRAGDVVLTEFARRIRGVVREVDLAFRQGGEEFVILLPETDVAGSLTAARRLGEAVRAEPFVVGSVDIALTVSIGVAVYPRHATSPADILEAADTALYAAKAAGRDTFVLATIIPSARRASAHPVPAPTRVVGGPSVRTACTQIPTDG